MDIERGGEGCGRLTGALLCPNYLLRLSLVGLPVSSGSYKLAIKTYVVNLTVLQGITPFSISAREQRELNV